MREAKQEPVRPLPPTAFLKNKAFVKWSKAETCKKDDNIVSTDWHEKLQRTEPFTPAYDNAPLNMVYLLSGEYGRIWQKERDEWYNKTFTLPPKVRDMEDRKKKIRKQIKDAKKAAEISIKERKERKAKEAELKTKLELEKAEKLKAKQRSAVQKKTTKKQDVQGEHSETDSAKLREEIIPKELSPTKPQSQCECSIHTQEKDQTEKKVGEKTETTQQSEADPEGMLPTICENFSRQLSNLQKTKNQEPEELQSDSKTHREVQNE